MVYRLVTKIKELYKDENEVLGSYALSNVVFLY